MRFPDSTEMDSLPLRSLILFVFSASAGTVLFEVTFVRLFSALFRYHFAFLSLSTAMMGIALSGAYCQSRRLPKPGLLDCAALFSLAIAVVLPLVVLVAPITFDDWNPLSLGNMIFVFGLLLIPFFFGGLCILLPLQGRPRVAGTIYGASLVGAGVGGGLSPFLLDRFDPVRLGFLVAGVLALAAVVGLFRRTRLRDVLFPGVVALLCISLFQLQHSWKLVRLPVPREYASYRPRLDVWNRVSRLVVYDTGSERGRAWTPKASVDLDFSPEWVGAIDSCAGFPIVAFEGDVKRLDYLRYDISALPFYFAGGGPVAVVGAGGGKDLLTAAAFGSHQVDAIEINRGVYEGVNESIATFSGAPYSRPCCTTWIMDARRFFRVSRQRYALILSSMTDTWAAAMNGGMVLSESYLYTKEAVRDYVSRLADDGILAVLRYSAVPNREMMRLTATAAQVLDDVGVASPSEHVVVVQKEMTRSAGIGLLMLKKEPFSPDDVWRLQTLCCQLGFDLIAAPGLKRDKGIMAVLADRTRKAYVRSLPYDIRPVTDDRPFFFQSVPFGQLFHRSMRGEQSLQLFEAAMLPIFKFGLLAFLLTVGCLVAAVPSGSGSGSIRAALTLLAFALIGLAFMCVELALLQRFILFFSEPVAATAFVLSVLLVSAGLGSLLVDRVSTKRLPASFAFAIAAIVLLVGGSALLGGLVKTVFITSNWRFVLFVLCIAPLGFAMGLPFPVLVKYLGADAGNLLPSAWAVNGMAGVLGAVGGTLLAVFAGFRVVLLTGVGAYVLALACFCAVLRGQRVDTVDC